MSLIARSALRPLELLLNRGVRRSSSAEAIAAVLEGKSLDLRVDAMPIAIRLTAGGGRIRVTPPGEAGNDPASATLAGSLASVTQLLRGDPQAAIRDGDVRIAGDTDVANQFRDLLYMARPDIEDELSKLVGDPLAHRLGIVAREIGDWGARAADSVARSLGEYLTEERQVLPTKSEVEEFNREVDRLANDVDRAEARLARLGDQGDAKPPA